MCKKRECSIWITLPPLLLVKTVWIFLTVFLFLVEAVCHRHLLVDCFVIYAGLKETKGHLSPSQERDESSSVVKFPVELDDSIKGKKCHCFVKN